MFTADRTVEGVLGGYVNCLNVTNPAGVTIRVASGAGMVDGKFYENDANIDFTIAAPGVGKNRYDLVVLRKTMAEQIVKVAILTGVEAVSPTVPALTQNPATVYEVAIAKIYITDVPVITLTDMRNYLKFALAKVDNRQGGGLGWTTSGTVNYMPGAVQFEAGCNTISIGGGAYVGTITVTFPKAFGQVPLVFVSGNNQDYIITPTIISAIQVTITATHRLSTVGAVTIVVYWFGIGPR